MKKIFILGVLSLLIGSCEHEQWQKYVKQNPPASYNCDTTVVIHYAADIVPIMNKSCGAQDNSCHSSSIGSGFTVLDVYAGVQYCGTQAGSPPYKLISCIINDGNASVMPKNGYSISSCEINKVIAWVHQGAQNN